MPKSATTKERLVSAMKELLPLVPIEKLQVSQLCDFCRVHRKSFYYHFADKYDLLRWILESEIFGPLRAAYSDDFYVLMGKLVRRLDAEKPFYRACFRMERTNSFGNTFSSSFQDQFIDGLKDFIVHCHMKPFAPSALVCPARQMTYYLDTLAGSVMGNIQQWLLEQTDLTAEEYLALLCTTKAL